MSLVNHRVFDEVNIVRLRKRFRATHALLYVICLLNNLMMKMRRFKLSGMGRARVIYFKPT